MTSDRTVALLAIGVFSALSILAAVTSQGFLEADAGTHYLYARFAVTEWHYLTNVWGRPLCTGLYALPAYEFGRVGVRLTSLCLAVGCALVAWRVARDLDWPRPVLALLFTLAQPLVFLHSFSELTELPFALVVGLAFWAYVRRRWFLMACLIGLSPLGRPEGFGFLLLAGVALVAHRRAWWLPVLLIPLAGWNYAGWIVFGRDGPWWGWLASQWPYAGESLYASGSLFHFIALLPVISSPFIFAYMLFGFVLCISRPVEDFLKDHVQRCILLVALLPLSILCVHSLLYFTGKMASNGELRYLLVVAPLWGMLSAAGWARAFSRFQWRHSVRLAFVACLLPLLVNVFYRTVPIDYEQTWKEAREMAEWYRSSPERVRYPYFAASHTGMFYFLDVSPSDRSKVQLWEKQTIETCPPNTVLFWDQTFATFNADAKRKITPADLEGAGWTRLVDPTLPDLPTWRVYVSAARAFEK